MDITCNVCFVVYEILYCFLLKSRQFPVRDSNSFAPLFYTLTKPHDGSEEKPKAKRAPASLSESDEE